MIEIDNAGFTFVIISKQAGFRHPRNDARNMSWCGKVPGDRVVNEKQMNLGICPACIKEMEKAGEESVLASTGEQWAEAHRQAAEERAAEELRHAAMPPAEIAAERVAKRERVIAMIRASAERQAAAKKPVGYDDAASGPECQDAAFAEIEVDNEITGGHFGETTVSLVCPGCEQRHYTSPVLEKRYGGPSEVAMELLDEIVQEQGYRLNGRPVKVETGTAGPLVSRFPVKPVERGDGEADQAQEPGQEAAAEDAWEEPVEEKPGEAEEAQEEAVQEEDGDAEEDGQGDVQNEEGEPQEEAVQEEVSLGSVDSVKTSTFESGEAPVDTLLSTYKDGTAFSYVMASTSAQTLHIANLETAQSFCEKGYTIIPGAEKVEKILAGVAAGTSGSVCNDCQVGVVKSKSPQADRLTGKMTLADVEITATAELLAKAGLQLVGSDYPVDHKSSSKRGVVSGTKTDPKTGDVLYLVSWDGAKPKAISPHMMRLNRPAVDLAALRVQAMEKLGMTAPVAAPDAVAEEPVADGVEVEPGPAFGGFEVGQEVIRLGNPSRDLRQAAAVGIIEEITEDGTFLIRTWDDRGGYVALNRVLRVEDLDQWIIDNRPEWRLDEDTVPGSMTRPEGWTPQVGTWVRAVEETNSKGERRVGTIEEYVDGKTGVYWIDWVDEENEGADNPLYDLEQLQVICPQQATWMLPSGPEDVPAYADQAEDEAQPVEGKFDPSKMTTPELAEYAKKLQAEQEELKKAAAKKAVPAKAAPAAEAVEEKPKRAPVKRSAPRPTGVRTGAATGKEKGNPYSSGKFQVGEFKGQEFEEGTVAAAVRDLEDTLGIAGYNNGVLGRHLNGPAQYLDHLVFEELDAETVAQAVMDQRLDGINGTSTMHNMMLVARLCKELDVDIAGWQGIVRGWDKEGEDLES